MVETGGDLDVGVRRFRLLLRAYPRSWRANGRDEELLGVLLDSLTAAGRTTPSLADAANIIANGLATRIRFLDFVLPEPVRRHIAQFGLAAGTGASAFLLTGGEIRIGGWSNGYSPGVLDDWLPPTFGPFLTLGVIIYALWFLAFAFFLVGRPAPCRDVAATAAVLSVAMPTLATLTKHQRPPGGALVTMAVFGVGVAALPAWAVISARSKLGVSFGAVSLLTALVAWRAPTIYVPTLHNEVEDLRSRTMFYWIRAVTGINSAARSPVLRCGSRSGRSCWPPPTGTGTGPGCRPPRSCSSRRRPCASARRCWTSTGRRIPACTRRWRSPWPSPGSPLTACSSGACFACRGAVMMPRTTTGSARTASPDPGELSVPWAEKLSGIVRCRQSVSHVTGRAGSGS